MRRSRRLAAVAAIAGLALFASACGGGSKGSTGPTSPRVSEKDFSIAGPASLKSGAVTFSIKNNGPSVHELVVMKTDIDTSALPTTTEDGVKVLDEENGELTAVDEVEDISPGATAQLAVRLAPGTYIMFCNIPGHFAQGMVTSFTVSG